MKILSTSDIHQMGSKWKDLVELCQEEQFDVVAIAGDIFPKDQGILAEMGFVGHLLKYADKIKATGAELVFTLGNDDNQLLIPEMISAGEAGHWHYLENNVVKIGDYEFAGMPFVPDYPFGYKYWCAGEFDNELRIDEVQFCEPLLVNENNQFYEIDNYKDYIQNKPKIYNMLNEVKDKVEDMSKSIWLIHAPPAKVSLDVCAHGGRVGSTAVLKFLDENDPFISIHGHIHEAPEYNGFKWNHKFGESMCIQGGQTGFDLHYVALELDGNEIVSMKHSKYN